MSLINDALKKAESERNQRSEPTIIFIPQPPEAAKKGRRKWRYIRGFIISIIVVGTLTTLSTNYLINQLLKESESPALAIEKTLEGESLSERLEIPLPRSPADEILYPEDNQSPESNRAETPPPPESRIDSISDPVDSEAISTNSETNSSTVVEKSTSSANPPTPEETAKAFHESLEGLEIRGIMQSSGRILIYDPLSGRTRTYSEGDALEGHKDCIINAIETNFVRISGPNGLEHSLQF